MSADPILEPFDRLVARSPDAPLVIAGARRAGAALIDRLARTLAERLRASACEPGSPVLLTVPHGPAFLAALVATRREGWVPVLVEAATPAPECERIARHVGATAVLGAALGWPADSPAWHLRSVAGERRVDLPAGTAYVRLTSGSTGAPRAIALSSDSLAADDEALRETMGIQAGDRLVAAVPFAHAYGFGTLVLAALRAGLTLVLPEGRGATDTLDAARHGEATVLPTSPAYLRALLALGRPPAWPPSLRLVVSAGAPLAPEVAVRFRETFGRPVHTLYGASEVGGICYDRLGSAAERGTVGTPLARVQVSLAAAGSVVVHSPAAGLGYVSEPSERLGGGLFHSSDVGTWEAAELRLLGRSDDVINARGLKVDPREVEAVILEMTPVEEAVVLGVPAGEAGAGQIVRAFVACRPGSLRREEVIAWCRARLAPHKVPRSVAIVAAIPRTSRGKVDHRALLGL